MRILRNCSNEKDYEEQSEILIQRFIEKGYKRKELEILKAKVKTMDRETLLKEKRKKPNSKEWAFSTGFNR